MSAIVYNYQVGEIVEARDPSSGQWRLGTVVALRPYRGRPGYDVYWIKPHYSPEERKAKDLPMPSCGGWQYEACIRKRVNGLTVE